MTITEVLDFLVKFAPIVILVLGAVEAKRRGLFEKQASESTANKTDAEADMLRDALRKDLMAEISGLRLELRAIYAVSDEQARELIRVKRVADQASARADEAITQALACEGVVTKYKGDVTTYRESITELKQTIVLMREELDGSPAYIKKLLAKLAEAGIDVSNIPKPPTVPEEKPPL